MGVPDVSEYRLWDAIFLSYPPNNVLSLKSYTSGHLYRDREELPILKMKMQQIKKAMVILLLAGLVAAVSTNQITTSAGDLNLASTSGNINIASTNTNISGVINSASALVVNPADGSVFGVDDSAARSIASAYPLDFSYISAQKGGGITLRGYWQMTNSDPTSYGRIFVQNTSGVNALVLTASGNVQDIRFNPNNGYVLPISNNSVYLGSAALRWKTIYATTALNVGDIFMTANPDYMIRIVEKPEGEVTQYIPKEYYSDCKDTLTEHYDDCEIRVSEEHWDDTIKTTKTYDGDFINSDGISMRDTIAENQALKAVLVDKGVLTDAEVSAKVQVVKGGLQRL
jgi:hypothetical protein